jgi:hypothetical protein
MTAPSTAPSALPPLRAALPALRLALPAWARRQHPIVYYETRHWSRSTVWRTVRRVVWGGGLVFLLVPAGCALLFGLGSTYTSSAEAVVVIGGLFSAGLAAVSVLATWVNNLTATLLGATLIARERECQTWAFLRLTSLTSVDIVGSKLAAVAYSLARSLHYAVALRLLALLSAAVTLALGTALSSMGLRDVLDLFAAAPLAPADIVALVVYGSVALLAAGLAWLAEPYFGAFYNAVVGVAASSLARSRGNAIVTAVAAHFVLWLGVYGPVDMVLRIVLALAAFGSAAAPAMAFTLPAQSFLLQTAAQVLLRVAVLAVCLAFTLQRVEHLSE